MFDSNAITKIQSAILASIIVVAAVGGTITYVLLSEQATSETIKIGFFGDIGTPSLDVFCQSLIKSSCVQ